MYFSKPIQERLKYALDLINNNYPTINSGGCGVFAVMIHDQLEKMGIKSEFHMLCRDSETAERVMEVTDNLEFRWMNWGHVIVSVGEYYIDSTGIYPSYDEYLNANYQWVEWDYEYISGHLNKDLIRLHADSTHWNPTFDRELIPTIKQEFTSAVKLTAFIEAKAEKIIDKIFGILEYYYHLCIVKQIKTFSMKKIILLFVLLLTIVSCKKDDIKPNPCNKHFVEMYTSTGYADSIYFYHDSVEVLSNHDEVTNSGGIPSMIDYQLAGFYAYSGDTVQLKTYKGSNGLFTNWIRVDGAVVVNYSEWVTPSTQHVTLTYVIP
jgi:hypothetical protein